MTLIEVMLAVTITAMVAGAIAGMMAAVSAGVTKKRDTRAVMVRANAAQVRLSAYVVPARCVLDVPADGVVVWLNDSREGGTVNISEVRWLFYDATSEAIAAFYVVFPDDWTEAQKSSADRSYPTSTNWKSLLSSLKTAGVIETTRLVDGLGAVAVTSARADLDTRVVNFDLSFETGAGATVVRVAPAVRRHRPPSS